MPVTYLYHADLPLLIKSLVLSKLPSASEVHIAGTACQDLRNTAAELLGQFRWQCRACGHALYHPKHVTKPSVERVFGTIAQVRQLAMHSRHDGCKLCLVSTECSVALHSPGLVCGMCQAASACHLQLMAMHVEWLHSAYLITLGAVVSYWCHTRHATS